MKFKNFLIALLVILLILALGAGYLMLTGHVPNPFETQKQATITAEEVEEQISKAADLSTAKLTYKGIVNFTEGQIKYITQNSFNMMYTADIVAGVDMTKVTVDVVQPEGGNPGKVTVTVPKPTIQKWALFNKTANTDVQEALKAAEADARANFGKKELIATAQEQADEVIRGFVQSVLPNGYELEMN